MFWRASPLISPPNLPTKGRPQSAIVASSKLRASRLSSFPLAPEASNAAMTLPALLPTTISGRIPWASSALITPIWAKPRAAPAPRTRPMTGLRVPIRLHPVRLEPPRRAPKPRPKPKKRRFELVSEAGSGTRGVFLCI